MLELLMLNEKYILILNLIISIYIFNRLHTIPYFYYNKTLKKEFEKI